MRHSRVMSFERAALSTDNVKGLLCSCAPFSKVRAMTAHVNIRSMSGCEMPVQCTIKNRYIVTLVCSILSFI